MTGGVGKTNPEAQRDDGMYMQGETCIARTSCCAAQPCSRSRSLYPQSARRRSRRSPGAQSAVNHLAQNVEQAAKRANNRLCRRSSRELPCLAPSGALRCLGDGRNHPKRCCPLFLLAPTRGLGTTAARRMHVDPTTRARSTFETVTFLSNVALSADALSCPSNRLAT